MSGELSALCQQRSQRVLKTKILLLIQQFDGIEDTTSDEWWYVYDSPAGTIASSQEMKIRLLSQQFGNIEDATSYE